MIIVRDTEDRYWWYKYGEVGEQFFVDWVCPDLDLDGIINPEKEVNPTVPDLLVDGKLSDLKTQKTPFFTAGRYHKKVDGISVPFDPTYTVTFNVKDFNRYSALYPSIDIYFWVKWKDTVYAPTQGDKIEVAPISGVWVSSFEALRELIYRNEYPIHAYARRQGKTGNATESFLIDLRDLKQLSCKTISEVRSDGRNIQAA